MTDILSIGLSSLLANQVGISTIGQNIANANNENYTRQEVIFSSSDHASELNNMLGGGVLAEGTRRLYDNYLVSQLRYSNSQFSGAKTLNTYAAGIGSLIADSTTGLTTPLEDFFNAFQNAENDPSSNTARSNILTAAESLKNRFSSINGRVLEQQDELNKDIINAVADINGLTAQLATINQKLQSIGNKGVSSQPNSLLDSRDEILLKLSNELNISVINQANGVAHVYLSGGETLVSGDQATALTLNANVQDTQRPDLTLEKNGQKINVTSHVTSGLLGGLLQYRDTTLKDFESGFHNFAINLVNTVNQQHEKGLTLNNSLGGQLFQINTGTTSDLFNLAIGDVNLLALSQPVIASAVSTNVGSGVVSHADVFDINTSFIDGANKILRPPLLVRFTSATTYEILDNTNPRTPIPLAPPSVGNTFIPGTDNSIFASSQIGRGLYTGYQVVMNGSPSAGDKFVVNYNTNGFLDNRNAVALSDLKSNTLDAYNSLVFNVNSDVHNADVEQASATTLLEKAKNDHQSLSGVNLDEEAAQLTKYQQTFNASAQLISISKQIIDDLLNIF